jgi:hypothetical protein
MGGIIPQSANLRQPDRHRINKAELWDILELWDEFSPRKIRLVACGGTALTIQDLKPFG